jgi:hypothetical protein
MFFKGSSKETKQIVSSDIQSSEKPLTHSTYYEGGHQNATLKNHTTLVTSDYSQPVFIKVSARLRPLLPIETPLDFQETDYQDYLSQQ